MRIVAIHSTLVLSILSFAHQATAIEGEALDPNSSRDAVSVADDGDAVVGQKSDAAQDDVREAMATYFGGLGSPAGGCGLPQAVVESSSFVALNVQNAQPQIPGEFDHGRNCGRWIEVTLSKFCKNADHSDRWNSDSCAGGQWEEGALSGAKATFIVADSCNDANLWCRNDRYHLDLSASGLSQFGGGMNVSQWRNPQIKWHYVDAPNYSGDIRIGFAQNASGAWPAIIVNHLQRGLHRIEQWVGGRWVEQGMFMTLGQVFILTNVGAEPYRIRLFDAYDQPIQNGRVYRFTLPAGCCGGIFNEVSYVSESSF